MRPRLDLIALVVQDMARSLAFYRHLDLELPPDADRQRHVETTLEGGLRLAWDTVEAVRSYDPDWAPPSGGHRVSLAFRLVTPADVDRTYDRLVSLGYEGHKQPWDAPWGERSAFVHDPDGNAVELFAPAAG